MQFFLDVLKGKDTNLHLGMRWYNLKTGYGGNNRLKETVEKISRLFRNYILIQVKFCIQQQVIHCND